METRYVIQIGRYVLLKWVGEPSLHHIICALRDILVHPGFKKGMPAICHDEQSAYHPSIVELRAMAAELGRLKEQFGPLALVVRTDLHVGLGSVLRAYCHYEGLRFEVFRRMEDALLWIQSETGMPPPNQSAIGR